MATLLDYGISREDILSGNLGGNAGQAPPNNPAPMPMNQGSPQGYQPSPGRYYPAEQDVGLGGSQYSVPGNQLSKNFTGTRTQLASIGRGAQRFVDKLPKDNYELANQMLGFGENALSMLTGAGTGVAAAIEAAPAMTGMQNALSFGQDPTANQAAYARFNERMDQGTYQPRSEMGQAQQRAIGEFIAPYAEDVVQGWDEYVTPRYVNSLGQEEGQAASYLLGAGIISLADIFGFRAGRASSFGTMMDDVNARIKRNSPIENEPDVVREQMKLIESTAQEVVESGGKLNNDGSVSVYNTRKYENAPDEGFETRIPLEEYSMLNALNRAPVLVPLESGRGHLTVHGSNALFDEADPAFQSTGTGVNAYGSGALYTAERPSLAEQFRDDLADGVLEDGVPVKNMWSKPESGDYQYIPYERADVDPAFLIGEELKNESTPARAKERVIMDVEYELDKLKKDVDPDSELGQILEKKPFNQMYNFSGRNLDADEILNYNYAQMALERKEAGEIEQLEGILADLKDYDETRLTPNEGYIYEVDIPDEAIDSMLEWDAPLGEQPKSVRDSVSKYFASRKLGKPVNKTFGLRAEFHEWAERNGFNEKPVTQEMLDRFKKGTGTEPDLWKSKNPDLSKVTGEEIYNQISTSRSEASQVLAELGIPGIRYYENPGLRDVRPSASGARNYVPFDKENARVISRNGEPVNVLSPETEKVGGGVDDTYRMQHTAPTGVDDGSASLDKLDEMLDDFYDLDSRTRSTYYGLPQDKPMVEALDALAQFKGKPDAEVTIYRVVPGDVDDINPNDWVTHSRFYAEQMLDDPGIANPKILEQKVRAGDLYWNGDSPAELGYSPKSIGRNGEKVGGAAEQMSIAELSSELERKYGLYDLALIDEGDDIYLDVIQGTNSTKAGNGEAAIKELMDYADETGKRIVGRPSDIAGFGEPSLRRFYKRLGFKENYDGAIKDYKNPDQIMYYEPRATSRNGEKVGGAVNSGVSILDDGTGKVDIQSGGTSVGRIEYVDNGNTVQIKRSDVQGWKLPGDDMRSKGIGTDAYKQFIDKQLAAGKTVESDSIVSAPMVRVYEKLREQGYDVVEKPGVRTMYTSGSVGKTSLSRAEMDVQREAFGTTYDAETLTRTSNPGNYEGPGVYTITSRNGEKVGDSVNALAKGGIPEPTYTKGNLPYDDSIPSKKRGSVVATDFARELEKESMDNFGPEQVQYTDENVPIIARNLADEIKWALKKQPDAFDWYEKTLKTAHEIVATRYPEIATNPNMKSAFNAALAVTSNGQAVELNAKMALEVYDYFRTNKRFPEEGLRAKESRSMHKGFKNLNKILDRFGGDGAREFMDQEFTVRELEKEGFKIGGENKDTVLNGSVILGPKVGGGFYQNLSGNFNPTTFDLWFSRTWGRHTNRLFKSDKQISDSLANFRLTLDPAKMDASSRKYVKDMGYSVVELRKMKNAEMLEEFAEKAYRLFAKGGFNEKTLIHNASRNYLSSKKPKDSPAGGGERAYMRRVIAETREQLSTQGIEAPNAAIQALLWYYEKALWEKGGVRPANGVPDYEQAFRKLID